jgi:Right handed beta helix region
MAMLLSLLTYCGFCFFSVLPGIAGKNSGPNEVIVNNGSMHFVAVNGNDNGPGTADRPWATINYAAELAEPGDTVIVRGGHYVISDQVRPRNSGRRDAWITFMGFPGEEPILDAHLIPHSSYYEEGLDNGAFQIERVSYIRVVNLTVINSHDSGFTIRDSSNVELINNTTRGTFSSGINVWDTNHEGNATQHIQILGNTIVRATTWDLASPDLPKLEVPHEALSIGGAVDFEVAYNHIYDSDKEGIDIKETSKKGKVHHNLVHNLPLQCIYIDAWFGEIRDIEVYANVIRNCRGAGLVLSVENGRSAENVNIHHNLIFNNDGSGLLFSRWSANNPRFNIEIANNVFYHNGYGTPKADQTYYWITGGLYLYTTNIHDIIIKNNIFSDNRGFQIGYSQLFLDDFSSWEAAAQAKNIQITGNLIDGRNTIDSPIESGGNPIDRVKIYAVSGSRPIFANPMFKDPANQDFSLRRDSLAMTRGVTVGAYAPGVPFKFWWKRGFPPDLAPTSLGHP